MMLVPALAAFGQSGLARSMWGFSVGGLFPSGAFNDHVGRDGFGLDIYYGRRIRTAPLFVGFDLLLSYYGHVHRHEQPVPEVRVDVDTFNNIAQGLFFVRLQPRSGRVVTYVQGMAGLSYLFTDTTISGHQFGDELYASDTNFDDLTVAAGAEAGLAIRLDKRRDPAGPGSRKRLFLELKVRYTAGGRADYLRQGSLVVIGDEVTYTVERSATGFVTAQAALTWL
jgi:hypothetical protein